MRGLAVRHHHFAHHQHAVGALRVGIDRDRLQHAIRAPALGLIGRAAVEAPVRELFERRKRVELLDLRLAAQIWYWGIPIEPNILESILSHSLSLQLGCGFPTPVSCLGNRSAPMMHSACQIAPMCGGRRCPAEPREIGESFEAAYSSLLRRGSARPT